nr:uncharacterized protein LOC108943351 [Nicotiana tomentosiformis]
MKDFGQFDICSAPILGKITVDLCFSGKDYLRNFALHCYRFILLCPTFRFISVLAEKPISEAKDLQVCPANAGCFVLVALILSFLLASQQLRYYTKPAVGNHSM